MWNSQYRDSERYLLFVNRSDQACHCNSFWDENEIKMIQMCPYLLAKEAAVVPHKQYYLVDAHYVSWNAAMGSP